MALPDFFLAGAPKAGTTALHAALARHPDLRLSPIKEPKFYLCDGRRPRRRDHRGPGDAHSRLEWVWRREEYERLFDGSHEWAMLGESTPFYLYDTAAQDRIHADVPHARFVVVLRDPVDRAYSNWMHLRSDGLEPEPDFLTAMAAEDRRVRAGWAPFWHYRRLGLYGRQVRGLIDRFGRHQVHVLRYRDLVDRPDETVDAVCRFLGARRTGAVHSSAENVKPFVPSTPAADALRRAVRAGAWLGSFAPPQVWRQAGAPVIRRLHAHGGPRPALSVEQRRRAVEYFAEDVALLETVLGNSYRDWLADTGRGSFSSRVSPEPKPPA